MWRLPETNFCRHEGYPDLHASCELQVPWIANLRKEEWCYLGRRRGPDNVLNHRPSPSFVGEPFIVLNQAARFPEIDRIWIATPLRPQLQQEILPIEPDVHAVRIWHVK